jgi:hypothetical protein
MGVVDDDVGDGGDVIDVTITIVIIFFSSSSAASSSQ